MAIEIIDKIKQKNGGTFKLIDAIDVEMKNGKDLETHLENISGSIHKGDEAPDDNNIIIWDDTSENSEYTGDISDSVIEEFKSIFSLMQNQIVELKNTITGYENRIAYLEFKIGGQPENPDDSNNFILTFEDGSTLTFEDGLSMIFETN